MKRRLIFDGQVFQSPAWHRGMGKYSLELIASLYTLNESKNHWQSIQVVFSENLNLEQEVIDSLRERTPKAELVWLDFARNEYDHRAVADKNRPILEDYIKKSFKTDDLVDFVVLSLMQSEVSSAFPQLANTTNYLLFYDLIPLMFCKTYLTEPLSRKSYLTKIRELLKADYYLAISKTVANDLAIALGIDTERIISIDGAPIKHGNKSKKISIPEPFILMPTGNDLRKNNQRGIEGFAEFNRQEGEKYHLVVTSTFQEYEVKEYKKITDKVIFTGNVSGEELEYLYENTAALLFPTEYEGLGMPVLEALQKDKPVACSDISVFREISEIAFSYFDPKDTKSIADGIKRAVGLKKIPTAEYKRVLDKFTWQRTAELFLEFARGVHPGASKSAGAKHIALFAPSVDNSTELNDTQHLYSELQRHADVYVYTSQNTEDNSGSPEYLSYVTSPVNIQNLAKADSTEIPIYIIGNSESYASTIPILLANRGLLILNDIDITRAWQSAVGRKIVHQTRLDAEMLLEKQLKTSGLLLSVLASQDTVIVHSRGDLNALKRIVAKLPDNRRPQIIYVQKPKVKLPYTELTPSDGVYDYPKSPLVYGAKGDFAEYATILTEQLYKEEV